MMRVLYTLTPIPQIMTTNSNSNTARIMLPSMNVNKTPVSPKKATKVIILSKSIPTAIDSSFSL